MMPRVGSMLDENSPKSWVRPLTARLLTTKYTAAAIKYEPPKIKRAVHATGRLSSQSSIIVEFSPSDFVEKVAVRRRR